MIGVARDPGIYLKSYFQDLRYNMTFNIPRAEGAYGNAKPHKVRTAPWNDYMNALVD